MPQKLITSYPEPDLDGTACVVAYEEFLNKAGEKVKAGIYGRPDEEARFLLDRLDIEITEASDIERSEVILLDASFPDAVSDEIDNSEIVEIIDHRKNHEADKFQNAEVQIELVGAAATLIAEKFREKEIEISDDSATLLYAAIKDNTVDFQANVTTSRDREIADWLDREAEIDRSLTEKIFEIKSSLDKPVNKIIQDDYYSKHHHGKKIGVSQIEALETEEFVEKNKEEIIETLRNLKETQELDHAFLTGIDIEKGKTILIAGGEKTAQVLNKSLKVQFKDLKAEKTEIILRKELMPRLKEELK